MNMPSKSSIQSVEIQFPQHTRKGVTYIDLLEFTPKVSWQNMSDAQYKMNCTDYSLIPDFTGYRNAIPKVEKVITDKDDQITVITNRLTAWYLGSEQQSSEKWVKMRRENEKVFIQNGLKAAQKIKIQYNEDRTPKGEPLFPMGAPSTIDGIEAKKFRTINENILLP